MRFLSGRLCRFSYRNFLWRRKTRVAKSGASLESSRTQTRLRLTNASGHRSYPRSISRFCPCLFQPGGPSQHCTALPCSRTGLFRGTRYLLVPAAKLRIPSAAMSADPPPTPDAYEGSDHKDPDQPEQDLSRDDAREVQVVRVGSLSVRSLPPRPSTRRHHRQSAESEPSAPGVGTSVSPSRSNRLRSADEGAESRPELTNPDDRKATEHGHPTACEPGFEYLDHTADVIIHAWGTSLREAFVNAGKGLFGYMTDTSKVEPRESRTIEATGSDLENLLFHFMDELLFLYGSEYFVVRELHITRLDEKACALVCDATGEPFDRDRHSQGTEVKAITMHEMKIWRKENSTAADIASEQVGTGATADIDGGGHVGCDPKAYEVFVLVDI